MNQIELKAKMLCEGVNVDKKAGELFQKQNPSNVKRGGLGSGGKIQLENGLFVNVPFYRKRKVDLKIVLDPKRKMGILVQCKGKTIARASVLPAPDWYKETVSIADYSVYDRESHGAWRGPAPEKKISITNVITAHNKQLAMSVYEDCKLFSINKQCQFCVMDKSLCKRDKQLVIKKPALILQALKKIPIENYGGLTLNGGMTLKPGRGMELLEPVVREIKKEYPNLPIAVEITPPESLSWINLLVEAGVDSLMMNLEFWDEDIRQRVIPGKNQYCPRESYLQAFKRANKFFGEKGRVSSCFIVGIEPIDSLKKGIVEAIDHGAIPSLISGRYFEDVPGYSFIPDVDWKVFLELSEFVINELHKRGLGSCDKAGCVACKMCDLIKDLV